MNISDQKNISFSKNQDKNEDISNTKKEFDELENKFYKNIEKLEKLKKNTPEFNILCSENQSILNQIHNITLGAITFATSR